MLKQLVIKHSSYRISEILLVGSLSVLTVVIAIVFVNFFASRAITYLLVLLLGLLVFGPILQRIMKHSFDIAAPEMWFSLFYFAHFGVRAIWDLAFGSPFLGFGPGTEDLTEIVNIALGTSILGFLSFWFGYRSCIGHAVACSLPHLPSKWDFNLILPITLLSVFIGWGVRLFLIISQVGSISAWITYNKDILMRLASGDMYFQILSGMSSIAIFLVFISARLKKKQSLRLLFLLLLVPELGFRFISGSRAQIGFLLLELLIAYYMTSSRRHIESIKLASWSIVILVLLVLLFPMLSAIRFYGNEGISQAINLYSDLPTLFEVVGDRFHGLDSLALIINKVPNDVSYTFGSELGLLAVSWIPRTIWPDKPTISLGKIFYQEIVPPGLFEEGTSVAVTLPGQFYWGLGIVGILIGMMFIGILWRFLYEYLVRPRKNLSNMLIVTALFPSFFTPVEQDLISIFTTHLFSLFVVLMIVFFLAKKRIKIGWENRQ